MTDHAHSPNRGQEPTAEVLILAKLNQTAWITQNAYAFTRQEGRQSKSKIPKMLTLKNHAEILPCESPISAGENRAAKTSLQSSETSWQKKGPRWEN
jgi:hypothetical protein